MNFKLTPKNMSESIHQKSLMQWARMHWWGKYFFHIPNEIPVSFLSNPWPILSKRKAEGVLKGVLDNFLMIPVDGYHGLWIELKAHGKKPSKDQLRFMDMCLSMDYQAEWSDNLDRSMELITNYMGDVMKGWQAEL